MPQSKSRSPKRSEAAKQCEALDRKFLWSEATTCCRTLRRRWVSLLDYVVADDVVVSDDGTPGEVTVASNCVQLGPSTKEQRRKFEQIEQHLREVQVENHCWALQAQSSKPAVHPAVPSSKRWISLCSHLGGQKQFKQDGCHWYVMICAAGKLAQQEKKQTCINIVKH